MHARRCWCVRAQNTRRSLVSMRGLALKAQALYRGWVARVDLEVGAFESLVHATVHMHEL